MEVPIMSSEFCDRCREKKRQGEKEPEKPQSNKGITTVQETDSRKKPQDNSKINGFDNHDWERIFWMPRSSNGLHG